MLANTLLSLLDMDYYHHYNYSKVSNVEEDDDEQKNQNSYETSAVRSYDCVFCRQGFTSAQALGGHMNIHRKDRANDCKKTKEDNRSPDHEISYSSFNLNHSSYFSSPPGKSIAKNNHSKHSSGCTSIAKPSGLALFDIDDGRTQNYGGGTEELDLDLRLGRHP
ncbi:hypothetical protein Ancab_022414 [Ancistrocladus abbreviatus]